MSYKPKTNKRALSFANLLLNPNKDFDGEEMSEEELIELMAKKRNKEPVPEQHLSHRETDGSAPYFFGKGINPFYDTVPYDLCISEARAEMYEKSLKMKFDGLNPDFNGDELSMEEIKALTTPE